MAQCLVNDRPTIDDFRPETWGQLLDAVERSLVQERRVVTAVRFDGVDQPTYRSPELAATPVAAVARIDIDAEDARALLTAAVDAAAESLPGLVEGIRHTATALRAGAADGQLQLVALIGAVQSLVALTAAAAAAANASSDESAAAPPVVVTCGELESALQRLAGQQAGAHWPALADTLDADLAPAIARWHDVLDPIRERALA